MKLDASILGVVKRQDAPDVKKLSNLIGVGQVIEGVDGRRFRVVAKTASAEGTSFRLANPVGVLHVSANQLADMEPLPRGLRRLAHLLRFYAYNKDFDLYVKEAIKAHGLPVDSKMNWSKWLYGYFVPQYLAAGNRKPDETPIEETLHQFIIDLIYQKDVLESFDEGKVRVERNKEQSLERKVSVYLIRMFVTYRSMAVRILNRLQTTVPGKKDVSGVRENLDVAMMQPGLREDENEQNILDTPAYATQPDTENESWEDISHFRAAYGEWLENTPHEATTNNILKLLDIIINVEKDAGGSDDYKQLWMKETGKSATSFGIAAMSLSKTLYDFVEENPELTETSLIARLIGDIKTKKLTSKSNNEGLSSVSRAASLNLVAVAPSDLAQIPADTGRIPHDNTGNTSNAVILLDDKPQAPPRTVSPEIPAVVHGF